MTAVTQVFAAALRRFPWAVLIVAAILAGALSSLASQVVIATGTMAPAALVAFGTTD